MSLFGSYIQESVEVVNESYYTDYDYFSESLDMAFNEFEQFHQFLEEKVDVKAAGAKVWGVIVGAAKKLVKMLQDLVAKIRGFIGKIINNAKEVKANAAALKAAKAQIGKEAKAKAKILDLLKSSQIFDMSPEFEKAVNNVEPVEKLGVSIGVDGFKKGVEGKELVNNNAIAVFAITEDAEKCIVKKNIDNIDKFVAEIDAMASQFEFIMNKLKEFEGYGKKAEAEAKKFEAFAEKYQSQGLKLTSNNEDSDKLNKGADFMLAAEAAKKDVKLLTAYAAGLSKMTTILGRIEYNNYGVLKKALVLFGSARAEKKEEKTA